MKTKYYAQGFTLIELAMVLFIMGLLLSSFLAPLAARVEQRERDETEIQLEEIKDVLFGYVIRQGQFPCPDCRLAGEGTCIAADVDDGFEDRNLGECKSEVGNLPWADLGVAENDAWGEHFTYRVSEDFADDTDGTPGQADCVNKSTTMEVSYSLCSDGDINVYSSDAATAAATGDIAENVPAIVISHSKNWTDTASADEAENYDDGGAGDVDYKFVDKDYSQSTGSEYDDMMIWISPYILRTMSVKAGKLP